jgi:hypothetical protein
MRRESGSASGTGPRKKIRKVRQSQTSSLGGNAAAAHGYTPSKKPIPKQAQSPRQDLRKAATQTTEKEREVQYVAKMRRKAPAEAAEQQKIVDTEKRLNEKATKGRIKYDMRTGNYVQRRKRALLPDEDVVIDPKTQDVSKDLGAAKRQGDVKHAEIVAPALKVLDQTLRPTRAVAGGVDAALKGKGTAGILKAQKKGLLNNKGPTFGKVLRDQGVPKGIAGVAGFGLDVAADPTTYVTGGTGRVAAKAGEKAAADAAKRAVRNVAEDTAVKTAKGSRPSMAGGRENLAKVVAKQAAKRAVAPLEDKGSGVTVKLAGKELPGVRRATAKAGRGIRKATPEGTKHFAREAASAVNPAMTPAGMSKEAHVASRRAERQARARRQKGARQGPDRGRLLAQHVSADEHDQILAAYERNNLGSLPEHLQPVAKAMRSEYRGALRERRRAGLHAGAIGDETAVRHVPSVTADPEVTAKRLGKERRRLGRIQGIEQKAHTAKQVAQGRAEILSRNVAGARGELAARRVGGDFMAGRRGNREDILRYIDAALDNGPEFRYAGGGHGVREADQAIEQAQRRLRAARQRVKAAETAHEMEKAAVAAQRAARDLAQKSARRQEGRAVNYFPHMLEGRVEGEPTKAGRGVRTIRPSSAMRREKKQPIDVVNRGAEPEDRFSTNVPLVHANYLVEHGNAVAQSQLHRALADQGREIKPGTGRVEVREGEKVYSNIGGRLTPLDDETLHKIATARRDPKTGKRPPVTVNINGKMVDVVGNGRLRAIHEEVVERGRKLNVDERTAPGRFFDAAQGKWKRLATGTPGFHIRNAIGDTQMAFNAQGARVPTNAVTATGLLKRQTARDAAARKELIPGQTLPKTTKTVKIRGEKVNVDDLLDEMMGQGVLRSGYIGRELEELQHGAGGSTAAVAGGSTKQELRAERAAEGRARSLRRSVSESAPRRAMKNAGRSINRGFQNREDLMRAATYLYGRKNGLSKQEAADLSMAFHIDYGDLTQFERGMRRVAPFYTFSARALPMHVKTLLKTPGRIAGIEKARVELSQAFGLPDDWEGDVSEFKQRSIPFGVHAGGENVALDASLPVNMLNELPVSASPKDYAEEWLRFGGGMLTPAAKIPIEAATGSSLTFRKPIQPDYHNYTAAPKWATKLPEKLKKQLDIVDDRVDPRTGKKGAGWNVWTNYWVSQLPGLAYQFRQVTTEGSLQSGRHGWQKVAGVVGVKADPIDPATARIGELFERRNKIQHTLTSLGDRGQKGGKSSKYPEVVKLTKELARIDYTIYSTSVKRGDQAPLKETAITNKKLLKPRVKQRGMPSGKKRGKPAAGGFSSGGGVSGGGFSSGGGFK